MAPGVTLTDEMKQAMIGRESESVSTLVELGAIRRFAQAIGDDNPLWRDEVEARRSRYGSVTAPPTFLRSLRTDMVALPELESLARVLDGGSEWRYTEPVRSGDTITAVVRVGNISQRSLSVGPATFIIAETTYTNQFQQVVATQRSTLIRY